MTFVVADRVQETCAAPGTGTVTLLGAATEYQSFSSAIGANNTTFYAIADQSGANWEVGIGTVGATGLTLARTTVLSSSNAGSAVNFSVGIQNVWCDFPASKAVYQGISSFTAGSIVANSVINQSLNAGAFSYGTLNYSDTNIFASYMTNVNSYAQMILQNGSSGSAASVDFIVSSNSGTSSSYYGDYGINGSGFSGTGSFSLPNATYLYSSSGDLVLGSYTANAVHFVVNNGATDSATINGTTGVWTFASTITGSVSGNAGTVTNGLYSTGSYSNPSWLTSILGSIVSGNISGNAANITGTYAGSLSSGQITTALGYTPYNSSNPAGYLSVAVTSLSAGSGILLSGSTGAVTISASGGTASSLTTTNTTSGSTFYLDFVPSNGGAGQSVYNSGSLSYVPSTGTLTATNHSSSSDERLKKDWTALPFTFVEQLSKVKHGTFTRISSGMRDVGISAQSLLPILPEAVFEDDLGFLSVNYGGAALVGVIELSAELVQLKKEIQALKGIR